jgi:hypothetical protein
MTNSNIPSKRELLELLRAQATQVEDAARGLSAEQLEQGRYEDGWNARQILAHVAAIEWTYPRLIDLAKGPRDSAPPRTSTPTAAPSTSPRGRSEAAPAGTRPAASPVSPIDSYNARQVEKRADASVAELLEEFRTNRAALIAAVEATDDALFSVPITSAGGARGPLASVIKFVALDHVGVHVNDLSGGTQ